MSEVTSIQPTIVYSVQVAPGVVWQANKNTVVDTASPYLATAASIIGESIAKIKEQQQDEIEELVRQKISERKEKNHRLCAITTLAISTIGLLVSASSFAMKQWL